MAETFKGVDLGTGEQAKGAIRYHAENDPTWENYEIAKRIYRFTDIFRDRLIEPLAIPGREGKLPAPVIGFDSFDYRIYAYYSLGHNSHGLEDEIILNERHLERPLYSILETVLHEQLHLWQQRRGEHPVNKNYHNQEFVQKCESLGLHPMSVTGCHSKPADGVFEALMKEYGIEKPSGAGVVFVPPDSKHNWWDANGHKGRSTLEKWSCPECNLAVRVGVKRDIEVACLPCTRTQGEPILFVRSK